MSDESSDPGAPREPTWHRWRRLAACVAAMVLVGLALGGWVRQRTSSANVDVAARQADVEARGAAVMPFDQNLTMHDFTKTDSGGVETVTANDPADTTQIKLIQDHLTYEQVQFSDGNFSDPMAIHGMQMPGIDDLQQGARAGRLQVEYAALPDGARLSYTANDPALVTAIHTWFDAQVMDHGAHATG